MAVCVTSNVDNLFLTFSFSVSFTVTQLKAVVLA